MATNPVQEFNDVFPVLADELIAHLRSINIPENAIEWFDRVRLSSFYLCPPFF
jgi:farnesyl diphosphate synthase